MKATLSSARIAPKKAVLIADLVRGMPALEAIELLARTHKKGARLIEKLLQSAIANASQNDNQEPSTLVIRSVVVQQGTAYRRGVPMARGRVRPMRKFLSHIDVVLGVADQQQTMQKQQKQQKRRTVAKKSSSIASVSSTLSISS